MIISSILIVINCLLAGGPSHAAAPMTSPMTTSRTAYVEASVVAGRVVSDLDEPLPGVVVSVAGTPQITITNAAGEFLVTLKESKSILAFKCQGYRERSMEVYVGNTLTVKMYSLKLNTATSRSAAAADAESAAIAEGVASKPKVLTYAEVPPSFPGGEVAYRAYIRQNAHFPEEALAKRMSGVVFVSFVVDEQGRIIDAAILKGVGEGLDQEALRLIRLMPWWNPGKVGGKPVRVAQTLGIPFMSIQKEE